MLALEVLYAIVLYGVAIFAILKPNFRKKSKLSSFEMKRDVAQLFPTVHFT